MREKSGSLVRSYNSISLWAILIFASLLEKAGGQTYCEEKPKILFYRRGEAALVSGSVSGSGGDGGGNSQVDGDNHVVISNVNKEFLACVSSRNVEWAYEGHGEPSKFQESSNVDIQKYDDGSISYCLTSQITFSNKQSDTELSRHTGRYTCREIGNSSNTATVYVFASRRNSPSFLQSRKTLTLPLSPENITNLSIPPMKLNLGKRKSRGEEDQAKLTIPTPILKIPCVTTHPNVSVKLLKKGRNSFSAYRDSLYVFNPKQGFLLNVTEKGNLSSLYGEYKCVSSTNARLTGNVGAGGGGRSMEEDLVNRNTEDFVLISLIRPKPYKALPPVYEVYTSSMLNLTCESEEPVIMKEVLPHSAQDLYSYLDEDDYNRDRSDDIVETTEKTEEKTHVANYLEISPEPGRTGEIQCLTEKDGKVLHTWKYRIIRKRADKLSGIKFNKREKSFTCKSKLGAPARLSFVSCRTPSECRINRICLTKSENCRGYSNATRAFCERTTHFCGKIFYKGGSGLIRCIGEGIDEIRGFTDEAAADKVVRMGFGKLKASETALLQLSHKKKNDLKEQKLEGKNELISEGDRVNVTLHMGYYYFLYPVQWAVKFKNGSTIQLSPDYQTLKVEKLSRAVHATLTLPYTSATTFSKDNTNQKVNNSHAIENGSQTQPLSEIVALHALIPLRSSVEPSWKTITLPLTVYGKLGVPLPLSLDNEGEDLIGEQSDKAPDEALLSTTDVKDDEEDTEADTEGDEEEDVVEGQQENSNSTTTLASASTSASSTTTTTTTTLNSILKDEVELAGKNESDKSQPTGEESTTPATLNDGPSNIKISEVAFVNSNASINITSTSSEKPLFDPIQDTTSATSLSSQKGSETVQQYIDEDEKVLARSSLNSEEELGNEIGTTTVQPRRNRDEGLSSSDDDDAVVTTQNIIVYIDNYIADNNDDAQNDGIFITTSDPVSRFREDSGIETSTIYGVM